jgi:hypothetical protein
MNAAKVKISGTKYMCITTMEILESAMIGILEGRLDEPAIVDLQRDVQVGQYETMGTLGWGEMQKCIQLMRMMYNVEATHAQYCVDCNDWKVSRNPHMLNSPCEDHRRIIIECTVRHTESEILAILKAGQDRCANRYEGDSYHIYAVDSEITCPEHPFVICLYHVYEEEHVLNALDILEELMPELEFISPEPRNQFVFVNTKR